MAISWSGCGSQFIPIFYSPLDPDRGGKLIEVRLEESDPPFLHFQCCVTRRQYSKWDCDPPDVWELSLAAILRMLLAFITEVKGMPNGLPCVLVESPPIETCLANVGVPIFYIESGISDVVILNTSRSMACLPRSKELI